MPLWNIPYTFSNGTTADANQVDQNFTSLQNLINGGQDDANMKTGGLSMAIATEGVAPSQSIGLPYGIDVFGSTGFVLSGCTVTKDGTNLNQVNVTAGVAYVPQSSGNANGQLRRLTPAATNYRTSAANSTYYLDLNPDGSYTWGGHSTQANYITIATVTSDASASVNVITDTRATAANASAIPRTPAVRNKDGSINAAHNANLVFNPSWRMGSQGWSGIGSNGWTVLFGTNGEGGYLQNTTSTTTTVNSAHISVTAGVTLTLSADISTPGVTAGSVFVQTSMYDSSNGLLASYVLTATNGQNWTRYSLTFTTPANTNYAVVYIGQNSGTTNTNCGFKQIKLEASNVASEFSDDNTLNTFTFGSQLQLAQAISGGNKIQSGSVSITANATSSNTSAVTFPTAFASPPLVVVTLQTSDPHTYFASVSSTTPPTANGFTAVFYNNSASSASATVDWVAIGS